MAQESITKENLIFTDGTVSPGQRQNVSEECVPIYLETACNYHQGQDYFTIEEDFQNGPTIKRLNLKRRPRVAANNVEKPQSDALPGSLAPLLSASSDDARPMALSHKTRGRPPLPPPYGSSIDTTKNEGSKTSTSQKHPDPKPLPAARSLTSPRHNTLVEETLMETVQRLEQDKQTQSHPEPHPRRRLASFGGVSSVGSLSPFTGFGEYNQNNNGNKPAGTVANSSLYLCASHGIRGSTGSLKLSPQSSGRSTPVVGLSPLQHVRDQMVVALQRLKDLEEQVKAIPILQVKISVLQEEKRQLVSQVKNQNNNQDLNDVFRKRAYSMESSGHFQEVSEVENSVNNEEGIESIVQQDCTGLREFRQLTEEMQALERTIKGGSLQAHHSLSHSLLHVRHTRSVAANTDDIMLKPTKVDKCVGSELIETKTTATGVSELDLGIITEWEVELDAQQQSIESLKDRIGQLEAELKETALQAEMSRLMLELQNAEARNRVDKASTAKPTTDSKATEARTDTKSQAVGNHIEFRDASTGERSNLNGHTVGVSCTVQLSSVSVGPDTPMSYWVVKERVESREQCVGIHVNTNTQGVGTTMKMCDAEINTDVIGEIWGVGTGQMEYCPLAFGNCAVDMTDTTDTIDAIRTVDLCIMASPQTASQRTNTVSNSVSRFTNTRHAFNTNSSTNTVISTQEKHTNTSQTFIRTASVGNKVRDIECVPETRSVGIGTVAWCGSALKPTSFSLAKTTTRNTGVGFTSIHDNYLIGLKTRNMACGPSHLPDPIRTRSIGVGEGKIWNLSVASQIACPQRSAQPQWEPELNHYIEKMQRLLKEQQGLFTANYSGLGDVFDHGKCKDTGSKQSCMNTTMAQGGTSSASQPQSPANGQIQPPAHPSNDPCRGDQANSGVCHMSCNDAGGVKRKIQMMEQHASSALQDRPTSSHLLCSIMKKEHSEKVCSNNRKSLVKVIGLTRGLEPVSVHELSACGEMKEKEHKWNRTWKHISGVSDPGEIQVGKSIYNQDLRGYVIPDKQLRFKLNERMFLACQALKTHLSEEKALSSRDLHACLHTLQQEWFYVSSQKMSDPAAVEGYLSAFLAISPLVLQYVLNMADGNGNTVLHYSVSHSNFSIVKKILDSDVCNVNHQNKAGYTPIMLAALAAVETPEDMMVVKELFTKGDVNAKASQAGQTALMLAVSHGRMDMVRALLAQGAEVNLQDDEGSTALMCASEHGHTDIVNLLLTQPDCDPTLSDSDESTALSIALEAGHNDVALLLYAHANYYKGQTGGSHLGGKSLTGGKSHLE